MTFGILYLLIKVMAIDIPRQRHQGMVWDILFDLIIWHVFCKIAIGMQYVYWVCNG